MSAARRLPRLLLVTGMSGAGKSTVLDALEDMGWEVVDNLPADLLQEFVQGGAAGRSMPPSGWTCGAAGSTRRRSRS